MPNFIRNEDFHLIQAIPERDIVEMAVDLDILVPEKIDRVDMIERCILAILERGRSEGLPFSHYDKDDLETLGENDLRSLGACIGTSG